MPLTAFVCYLWDIITLYWLSFSLLGAWLKNVEGPIGWKGFFVPEKHWLACKRTTLCTSHQPCAAMTHRLLCSSLLRGQNVQTLQCVSFTHTQSWSGSANDPAACLPITHRLIYFLQLRWFWMNINAGILLLLLVVGWFVSNSEGSVWENINMFDLVLLSLNQPCAAVCYWMWWACTHTHKQTLNLNT